MNISKFNFKKTALVAIIISFFLSILIITLGLVFKEQTEEPKNWVLHSYGNNVALYKGNDIIEVYGSITLDTLTEEDKRQLDVGLVFQTKEEAINAIEDYDG